MAQYKWTPFTRGTQGESIADPAAREEMERQRMQASIQASMAAQSLQERIRSDKLMAREQAVAEDQRRYNTQQASLQEAISYGKGEDVLDREQWQKKYQLQAAQGSFQEREAQRGADEREAEIARLKGYRAEDHQRELDAIEAQGKKARGDYTWQQQQEDIRRPILEEAETKKRQAILGEKKELAEYTQRLASADADKREAAASLKAEGKETTKKLKTWGNSLERKELAKGIDLLKPGYLIQIIRTVGYQLREGGEYGGEASREIINELGVQIHVELAKKRDALNEARQRVIEKHEKDYEEKETGEERGIFGSAWDYWQRTMPLQSSIETDPEVIKATEEYEKLKADLLQSIDAIPELAQEFPPQMLMPAPQGPPEGQYA